ncbi:hypothetical protein STANM309S_03711 [Streptomyces tanashiensis]
MMSSFSTSLPTFMEMKSSFTFRVMVCDWSSRRLFFTYCWVMVEPPWVSPPLAMFHTARAIPIGSIPESSLKVLFSAEMTAFCMDSGIRSIPTIWRLVPLPVATIRVPSAQ